MTDEPTDTDKVTVYSSSDSNYPDPPEYDELDPGDTWRLATARKCPVCHTMTNKREIGGYPSRGSRQYCPANRNKPLTEHIEPKERHEKHEELSELLSRREELEQRLAQYDVDSDAGERTINRLNDELEVIKQEIRTLREWFGERFDDVKGIDPDREKVPRFDE
jgi:hypothetical protein